jgi:hypothetical protein
MNLEDIMQSETSQSQKNKYYSHEVVSIVKVTEIETRMMAVRD